MKSYCIRREYCLEVWRRPSTELPMHCFNKRVAAHSTLLKSRPSKSSQLDTSGCPLGNWKATACKKSTKATRNILNFFQTPFDSINFSNAPDRQVLPLLSEYC